VGPRDVLDAVMKRNSQSLPGVQPRSSSPSPAPYTDNVNITGDSWMSWRGQSRLVLGQHLLAEPPCVLSQNSLYFSGPFSGSW
jgi:hypothetical protein